MISDKLSHFFINERYAIASLLGSRVYSILFISLSIAVSALYLFLLPSLPLGSLVIYAIYYITPLQVAFSFIFGLLTSLVIVMNIHLWRINSQISKSRSLTIGSILASLVNGLCCTPIVPSLLAVAGVSTPLLYQISPRVQAFFEFNYPYFYLLSTAILLLSLHYLSKSLACCRTKQGSVS